MLESKKTIFYFWPTASSSTRHTHTHRHTHGQMGTQQQRRHSNFKSTTNNKFAKKQARARDDAKRSNSGRPIFSSKRRPTPVLGPRVTPDAKGSPGGEGGGVGGGGGGKANGAGTGAGDSSAATDSGPVRVRGRGSVQAPGVPGSQGGILASNVEAEVGRGSRQEVVVQAGQQQQQQREGQDEVEPIILDEMFRKTAAKPSLYWMPLLEEEVRGGREEY